jgi:hypothetical protein
MIRFTTCHEGTAQIDASKWQPTENNTHLILQHYIHSPPPPFFKKQKRGYGWNTVSVSRSKKNKKMLALIKNGCALVLFFCVLARYGAAVPSVRTVTTKDEGRNLRSRETIEEGPRKLGKQ